MLSYRDVTALLGLSKDTTMWELWHIQKGTIKHSYDETSRGFWSRNLRPHVIKGLEKRYRCTLREFESRIAFEGVQVAAAEILDPGDLPTGDAKYLVLNMISTEGYRHLYGQAEEDFLPTDRVHASLVQNAFGSNPVAFFLFIGNGEKEEFIVLGPSPETEAAIKVAVDKYLSYVKNDEEPDPDYELDANELCNLTTKQQTEKPYYADDDPELRRKIERYREISSEMSGLSSQVTQLKTEREVVKGFIANKLRGYSHGVFGNSIVKFRRQVRNVKPRVDEFVQLDIK